MEKTIKGKSFFFKTSLTMKDRSVMKTVQKKYLEDNNEFELCFGVFPIICISIDNKKLSSEEMRSYIEKCDDLEEFALISEVIADIYKEIGEDQKKKIEKMNSGIESQSETTHER